MLHALTNGVISTDKKGNIVATNPSAKNYWVSARPN
jgi:hypothetical protein